MSEIMCCSVANSEGITHTYFFKFNLTIFFNIQVSLNVSELIYYFTGHFLLVNIYNRTNAAFLPAVNTTCELVPTSGKF